MDRIVTPLFILALGASAAGWFIYRVFSLFNHGASSVVAFDKGSCYLLGASIGLLTLTYMIIREFWFKNPLTSDQNTFLSRVAIGGVVVMFVFPHVAHFAVDTHFKKRGYSICEEASHQWLFMRDIIYIHPTVECNAELEGK